MQIAVPPALEFETLVSPTGGPTGTKAGHGIATQLLLR